QDDMLVLDFFDDLNQQARRKKGKVISLCGNHEIYQCLGDMSYVSPAGFLHFGRTKEQGKQARIRAFSPGQKEAKRLARTRPAFVFVEDWLFGHAGMTPAIMKQLQIHNRKDLETLNKTLKLWLMGKETN